MYPYLLSYKFSKSTTEKEDIVSVIVNNGLANYFETNDAMYDLLQSGNIAEFENTKDYYILTGRGK